MKNMEIEINDEQPLDEVVSELGRLGYEFDTTTDLDIELILTWYTGSYDKLNRLDFNDIFPSDEWKITTLAELKEM